MATTVEGRSATPAHLWIVGVLALLWNAFGCYDYTMTRMRDTDYIKSMMPDMDPNAMLAYVDSLPIWASAGWGLGVSMIIDELAYGHMGSEGAWGWSGAASTFFTVDPAEDMTYVIMAQKMPTDGNLRNKIENLIYQALVE